MEQLIVDSKEDLKNLEGWVITQATEAKSELCLRLQKDEQKAILFITLVLRLEGGVSTARVVGGIALRSIDL